MWLKILNFKNKLGLKINWPEAYKKLIISITGSDNFDISFNDIPVIKNNISTSLPTCVYNAASKYKADYYFVFLGDAFISRRINNEKVEKLLSYLVRNSINYCRLLPQSSLYMRQRQKEYRNINSNERYTHSFVAFGAAPNFIKNEFSDNISDRDFEIRYLRLASKKENLFFEDRVILNKNIFHILPSIQKGKWDRINLFYLKKKYPQIEFSNRGRISWKYECVLQIRKLILPIIPDTVRKKVKNMNTKYFDTDL